MANGYMRAGAALGEAIAGNGRSAYNDQLGTEYKLAYALEQARQARNARVLGDQNVAKRQVIDNPDLLGQVLGGDANARNQYMTAVMLANENVNPDVLSSLQKTIMTQAGHDAATLGDYDKANQHLFAIGGAKQLSRIDEQNLMQNQYVTGGGGISTTDQGRSNIRRNDASAASSYASADNSRASAARTRQAMSLDRADVLGGGGRPASKAPSGYRWTANGSLEAIPGGPADKGTLGGVGVGKLTEGQGKDIVYYSRGRDSNELLTKNGNSLLMTEGGQGARGIVDSALQSLPLLGDSGVVNSLLSPERKQAKQAAAEFLSAILRKDTGAAITQQEFDIYGPMYLPMPGDDRRTLEQKSLAREGALESIKAGLGSAQAAIPAPRGSSRLQRDTLGDSTTLGAPSARLPRAPAPSAVGMQRARNPATGQVLVLRNGQWVPE
ncbi:hypothetical protein [Stenotrophomonas sp. C1657]|uniref:hypothetical protein n=1 Tax=Stenotrophomonas sp. C1657 TaxID=3077844 RepID=UPI00293CA4A8|nr:hypothetical protein [Stenotrophomonas sp. C1657]MDV3515172.1 hypothetical protein [Stenotrophomonas sp. C1657]